MLLATATVVPSYGQVKLQDHHTLEEIEWNDEDFYDRGHIAQTHVLVVRTCEPNDGDVAVEFHDAESPVPTGRLIFDGSLRIDSGFLSASAVDEDSRESVHLPRGGTWRLKVYGEPGTEPSRLQVIVS